MRANQKAIQTGFTKMSERMYKSSKLEFRFEMLLADGGFEILGVRQSTSSTVYQLKKGGVVLEHTVTYLSESAAVEYAAVETEYLEAVCQKVI